jgi:hypothetical protein
MKYINTNATTIWGKDEITKEYLIGVKQRGDTLINVEDGTYFDIEKNEWVSIPGDNLLSSNK